MFPFMDLCGKPVAAADYIALCDHFHTLVLKGVPVFKGSNRQEGYRWAAPDLTCPVCKASLTCASMVCLQKLNESDGHPCTQIWSVCSMH